MSQPTASRIDLLRQSPPSWLLSPPTNLRENDASKNRSPPTLSRCPMITKGPWYLACPANPNFFSQSTFEPLCPTRSNDEHISLQKNTLKRSTRPLPIVRRPFF